MEIKVKYFDKGINKVEIIKQGNWIDLRAAEDITLSQFESTLIPLGVGMKLPDGYEAILSPRSSTFSKYGIIQTNSIGVIDNSYSGNKDQWKMPVVALKDTHIKKNERIAQFRIIKSMDIENLTITQVQQLDQNSRGGFGSTGIK